MPFGVKNLGSTFQQLIDTCLEGLMCICIDLDNILIYSPSFRQHMNDVQSVLQCLRKFGLVYNPEKSTM